MLYAILSILFLTLTVWIINKKLSVPICPICAGVALTWLSMIFGMWFGLLRVSDYEFITAILMGASIGGIVTELKKVFLKWKIRGAGKNEEVESLKTKLKNCC